MVEEPGRHARVEDGRADDVVAVPVAAALRLGGSKHVDEDRGLELGQLRADAPRALVVAKHPQVVCAALAAPEGVALLDVLQRRLVHSHAGRQEVAESPVELPHAGGDVHRHEEVVCLLRVEHAVGGAEGAAVDDDVLAPQVHVLPPPVAARLQPAAEAARQLVHVQPRRARRPLAVLRADGRRQRRRRRGALGRRPERAVDAVEAWLAAAPVAEALSAARAAVEAELARHDGRRPLARVAVVARVAKAAAAPRLLALARRHTLGRHAARRRPDAVAAAALLGLAGERGERRGKVLGVGLQPPLVALLLDPAHQRLVGRVHDVAGAVAHHAERLARAKAFARDGCARPPVDQARRRDRGRRRLDHADQRSALGKERRPAARPTHEGRAGALPKPGVAHAAILDAVGRARLGRRL
mmetsp:Transcript_11534/g.38144  ORF Transcript_11534/g.38144 Transcript_11534/m.38144 type:complete len:414 (-) Transcript_11534:310-1551(-)